MNLSYLDLGGGLGIRYTREIPPDLNAYARALLPHIRTLGCRLLLEPGRAIVGPAGVLLTRVLHIKRNRGKIFVVVDAAMNDFIRPALYQAVHPITPVIRRRIAQISSKQTSSAPSVRRATASFRLATGIAGNQVICWFSGVPAPTDSRKRPIITRARSAAEVLVNKNQFKLVRHRESRNDLIRGE